MNINEIRVLPSKARQQSATWCGQSSRMRAISPALAPIVPGNVGKPAVCGVKIEHETQLTVLKTR